MSSDEERASKRVKLGDEEGADDDEDQELEKSALEQGRGGKDAGNEEPLEALYLDTVNRRKLDFDLAKVCSVTLSNVNVYACLTCGVYLQGRGKSSQAYLHSMDQDHHVFVNVETLKVYLLPDGNEVKSTTLNDIKFAISPQYSKEKVKQLDSKPGVGRDLWGKEYIPGFVGLNNIKHSDYANVVLHALAHVKPLRDFCLLESQRLDSSSLAGKFGLLVRKLWSNGAFKPHVSPHELIELVSTLSNKKFTTMTQQDPFHFLNWFLNTLHLSLGGSKTRPQSSLVHRVFQGKVAKQASSGTIPFMFLALTLPKMRIFGDNGEGEQEKPQVKLYDLIREQYESQDARFELKQTPPYLIVHMKRFAEDVRNNTVIIFDPESLKVGDKYHRLLANIVVDELDSKRMYKVQLLDKARDQYFEINNLDIERLPADVLKASQSYIQIWERTQKKI